MDLRELPIGRRVARLRSERRMTQQMLADRIGKSKSWVDKVERGVRRLDKFSVVVEIARVFRVSPSVLHGKDAESAGSVDRVDGVRAALARYDLAYCEPGGCPALPVAEVGRRMEHAWLTYRHAHYPQLLRMLPELLGDAQRARLTAGSGADAAVSARLLVQAYRIVASVLVKVGEAELAWLAADRAMAVAAGHPVGAAIAAVPVGAALRAAGRGRLAMTTVAVAHRLAPRVPHDAPPGRLSICGTLLIQAGLAAATCGDGPSAEDLIGQAAEIAERIGAGHDHQWTSFGPAAVQAARVAVELGEGRDAIGRHQDGTDRQRWRGLPVEYRAAYLLDVARGYLQIGDLAGAGRVVIEADQVAPAEIRSRPLARTLIGELVHGGPVPADVARLATAIGVG